MNRTLLLAASAAALAAIAIFGAINSATASAPNTYVKLQATSPGTAESGNANIGGVSIAAAFQGGGAGLTGLSASNITGGTLADSRLSSNAALLTNAQTFSGGKTFSSQAFFTAPGAPFSVSSPGLVANLNADLLDGLHASSFLTTVPVPLILSGSSGQTIIRGENASAIDLSSGVLGLSTAGTGQTLGVYGRSDSPTGRGVFGLVGASSGSTYGVYGRSASTGGYGVVGEASSITGFNYGGFFGSDSVSGTAVYGLAFANSGTTYGVYGQTYSSAGYAGYFQGRGVFTGSVGIGTSDPTEKLEVRGGFSPTSMTFQPGKWYGTDTPNKCTIDIPGTCDLLFWDNVHVNNTFTAGIKTFLIDHPSDPYNKFLRHGCIESDEYKNLYDGTVTTDARGLATVKVPSWFTDLNENVRYQLTVVDDGDSAGFVMAKVSKKLGAGTFAIRTSAPNVEVCWQITGVRKDAYAKANPLVVEEDKPDNLRGKLLHPEAFGEKDWSPQPLKTESQPPPPPKQSRQRTRYVPG